MMKKTGIFWKTLISVKLSIWLLGFSALMLLINSLLASRDFKTYAQLNVTLIWQWLEVHIKTTPFAAMAVILLMVALFALSLNTAACTLQRLNNLFHLRSPNKSASSRIKAWAPTMMHILFALVLAGHMLTFSLGQWEIRSAREGDVITFTNHPHPIQIIRVTNEPYESDGPLGRLSKKRTLQVSYRGRKLNLSELAPLSLARGDRLLLLLRKSKAGLKTAAPHPVDCSGDELSFSSQKASSEVVLKCVSDPGVGLIFFGFGAILLLLMGFYLCKWKTKSPEITEGS